MQLSHLTDKQYAMIYAAIARIYVLMDDDTIDYGNKTACIMNELHDFGSAYCGDISSLNFGTDPVDYLQR